MRGRVIAWVVLAVVLLGVYKAVNAWKNPWAVGGPVVVNPVLANLPASGPGCGVKCHD